MDDECMNPYGTSQYEEPAVTELIYHALGPLNRLVHSTY